MPAAGRVAWRVLPLIVLLLSMSPVIVSSIPLDVGLKKNQNVFGLRLLTHVHQISVAITHGRWNRKRIGPGGEPEPLSPAVLSLASMQRLTTSGRPCRDCCLALTPPHGRRPTSVDDLYLDGGLAFSWMGSAVIKQSFRRSF